MAVPTKDLEAFKRNYRRTGLISQAARAAGYCEDVARGGERHLPKVLKQYVQKRKRRLEKLLAIAKEIDAAAQEDIVRGALINNVVEGKDKAVNSLKLLGQDKRVSMFTPENQTGVIVIQAPALPPLPKLTLPATLVPSLPEGK